MEIYNLTEDLKVFGFEVTTFPNGVGEAFDRLVKMLPQGDERPYYGFFKMTKNGMSYKATALQTFEEEAEKYGLSIYTIEKGEYLSETVDDWMQKTTCIKDVFEELMKDNRADKTKPGVEVYKNMREMICMVKVDKAKEAFDKFEKAATDFSNHFALFSEEQINVIPFEGSWTAAQVAEHVRKSYELIAGLITGPAKPTERDSAKNIELIKKEFEDFTVKRISAEVIRPANISYDKENLQKEYASSAAQLCEAVKQLTISETCTNFSFPGLGELTRLELMSVAIYHTRRHTKQLKNILEKAVTENVTAL